MSEDQFAKLYRLIQDDLHAIRKQVENTDRKIDHIYGTVDDFAGQLDTHNTEHAMGDNKLDRHQDWIKQLAIATDTKLVPEP